MESGVVDWKKRQLLADVRVELRRRMERAVRTVETEAVKAISRDQPIRRTKSGRMVGLAPAKPGEPPRVLHGRLRQSVQSKIMVTKRDEVRGRVGTGIIYGRVHEEGTHPWLRPALRGSQPKLRRILGVTGR